METITINIIISYLNKYLMNTYYESGTVLGTANKEYTKQSPCSEGIYILI